MRPEMKRLRHLPIIWGPTPSRVATTALLGSRSHARTIFARNVSAAGSERDRVIATSCVRSSLEIVSIAFGRPVRIGYLLPSGYPKPCNNYATNLRDRTLAVTRTHPVFRLPILKGPAAMADIFISYSKADRSIALKLSAFLEAEGWTVWWDRSLSAGETYRDEIMKELTAARAAIVIWT